MNRPLVLPSYDDPVVAGAVQPLGGPPGAHARIGQRRFWTALRVLLALTLFTSLLGFAQKAPCRDGSNWVDEFQYTRACYTDVVALYGAEGLSAGKTPYYDHPVEYPVVIGGVMSATAGLARLVTDVFPDDRADAALERVRQATTPEERATAQQSVDYANAVARGRHFYDVTWLLLTLCALVVAVTTARLAGRRPWDAAMFALSPALLLHATTNWDLLAMAFAGLGLVAWSRRHPAWAGLLLGLATATKLYPVLFLVPLFALCLRAAKLRAWTTVAAITVLTAVGLTLPVYLTAPSYAVREGQQVKVLSSPLTRLGDDGVQALLPLHCRVTSTLDGSVRLEAGRCPAVPEEATTQDLAVNAVFRFFELNTTRGADWDSLPLQVLDSKGWLHTEVIAKHLRNPGEPVPRNLNNAVAVLEILVMTGVCVLAVAARRRPRLPQLLFLTLAGFLLVNKVHSPQYVLWLVPLALLARPRWRPFLAWQASEALLLLARFYFFVGNDKPGEGIDIRLFFAAVLVRDALLLMYGAFVVRDILRPDRDVVRQDGVDDPMGGVLDGAPDRGDRELSPA